MTKIAVPPHHSDIVSRPRLNERLTAGLTGKLTLIAAPPGFGKTTLVTEWLAHACPTPRRIAWVSLDAGDNDPGRFFTYVLRAIQTFEPDFGSGLINLVQSSMSGDMSLALVDIINDLSKLSEPVILVLDDYHVIDSGPVHDALGYILSNQPPNLHVIMTSRTTPPLPLSRLRSRREVNEIRADDLRFTVEEAAAFLNDLMGLDLPPERVAALERRTEGWIAGLLLAALSAEDASDADAVLDSFGGEHRYVFDYLAEEVLRRQPDDVRHFLDRTSVLSRVSAPLADALVESDYPTQEMLERLVASNLFTIPLDDRRTWYRYHHLFGEFLAARYREQDPDGWRQAHAAACDWFAAHGLRTEAVEHAVAIGDQERLIKLLEVHGQQLIRRGRIGTVMRWVNALPEAVIADSPLLILLNSWALLLSRRLDEAAAWLDLVDPDAEGDPQVVLEMCGRLAVCRATLARFRGDSQGIVQLAREALACFEQVELVEDPDYCVALLHLGSGYLLCGDPHAAIEVLGRALEHGQRGVDLVVELNALSQTAAAYCELGQFDQAEQAARVALEREREYGIRALAMAEGARWTLATILRERERFDEARMLVDEPGPTDSGGRPSDVGARVTLLYEHALVELAEGNAEAALESVNNAVTFARGLVRNPTVLWRVEGLRAHIQLLLGNTAAGIRWASEGQISSDRRLPSVEERAAIADAWVSIERGDLAEADELLTRLIESLLEGSRLYRLAQARLLLAVLRARQNRQDKADEAIDAALVYAVSQNCRRLLLDTHPEVRPLLEAARARHTGANPELAAFLGEILPASAPGAQAGLPEPLTEREIEVLGLLAEGLPNRDIAEQLFVSVGTVKRHTHNIYTKLEVSNRTRAITRGRELGLLNGN